MEKYRTSRYESKLNSARFAVTFDLSVHTWRIEAEELPFFTVQIFEGVRESI
jgi:hypothetical protein